MPRRVVVALLVLALGPSFAVDARAAIVRRKPPSTPVPSTPTQTQPKLTVTLARASHVEFPSPTDSNSPVFWELTTGGDHLLHILNSSPRPVRSSGWTIDGLTREWTVAYDDRINGDRWMEAVIPAPDGTLYGFYHNEPADVCGAASALTAPRIGAAVSVDNGANWRDLGIILEAPPNSLDCATTNKYDAGGVGDFTVVLDQNQSDLYIFYSVYTRDLAQQGVSVARLLWANRDQPIGNVAVWQNGIWKYPDIDDDGTMTYPAATPVWAAWKSWHSDDRIVDAFWGPSVHWNTALNQWVAVMNHAKDGDFAQDGIYISATSSLDDPSSWSEPQVLLAGGGWYPEVIGLESGTGTDRQAGARARFYMAGASDYEIVFTPAQ